MTLGELRPGDVLAYRPNSHIAFRALGFAQTLAGISDPKYAHVGIISRIAPQWTWVEEASAYTDAGVAIAPKYPWPCAVLRFSGLDLAAALKYFNRHDRYPYGFRALGPMGLIRKMGFRSFGLPKWTGWEHVCSPLVTAMLRAGGVDPFPGLHTSLAMPADFAEAQGCEVVGDWSPT